MNYSGLIKAGSANSEAVKAIKVQLNKLIGSTLDVTNGNFGDSTELVIKQFQRKFHLIQDGQVGELTWTRLFNPESSTLVTIDAGGNINLKAVEIGKSQLHVRELTNNNDGKEVEAYLKSVNLGKGYAWCMAFVFWCFQKAAEALGKTNPVPKTAGVLDCLAKAKAKKYLIINDPKTGDQGIMDFGGGKGHTYIVTERRGVSVFTVEGNTSADPKYAGEDREGNGVFERNRPTSGTKCYIRY